MIEPLKQAIEECIAEKPAHASVILQNLIAQLEKQEPVSWMGDSGGYVCYFDQPFAGAVPLYTHPAPAVPDDFMQQIEQWSQAYPLDIFPELTKEEWKRARRALDGSLVKLDRISASVIRHVITRVKEMLSAAPEYEGEK